MKINKLQYIINFCLAKNENYSLEHRLLISATLIGIFLCSFAAIVNIFLATSIVAVFLPIFLGLLVGIIYYFIRFKGYLDIFVMPVAIIGIVGVALIWIFNGGLDGANIQAAIVVLVLALVIVPAKSKIVIFLVFLLTNFSTFALQIYFPEIIAPYPDELSRRIDYGISLVYSSFFLFIMVKYIHLSNVGQK